jgi:RNA polymerase sigma factor (sigma-70 family)
MWSADTAFDTGASGEERIRSALSGDPAALNHLMAILAPMLRRYAQRQLGIQLRARMDASDLAQGALLEAARDLGSFSGATLAELSAWARGILRRNLLDHAKAEARVKRREIVDETEAPLTSPSQKVARREQVARIVGFAAELPAPSPRVVEMWLAGHSVREMADALERTEQAVASLLKRALEHVRARAAKAKW